MSASEQTAAAVTPSAGGQQELKRTMGMRELVVTGLSFLCPVAIFTSYGIVANLTHGITSLAYIIAMVAMMFTALSYGKMAKAFPSAGTAFTYASESIHPVVGFLTGWNNILNYALLPIMCYLVIGLFMQPVFPGVPVWVLIVAAIIITVVVNLLGVEVAANVNTVLIIIQCAFLIAFAGCMIKFLFDGNGAGTVFDMSGFFDTAEFNAIGINGLIGGAGVLALSFLGFDAIATMAEEAIDPEKDIARSGILVVFVAGAVFAVLSYFMQLSWPEGWANFASIDTGAVEIVTMVGGTFLTYFFTAAYVIGSLAAAIASMSSASRLLFSMGREGVLPKRFFSDLNKKKVPHKSILLLGVTGFAALFLELNLVVSLLSFGALVTFTVVNISVLAYYFVRKKQRSGKEVWKYAVLPVVGAIVSVYLFVCLDATIIAIGCCWLIIGAIYLVISRVRKHKG